MNAVLLLGTDLGEKQENLKRARTLIGQNCGPILRESSVYQSEPWGFSSDTLFLNQVLEIDTEYNPRELFRQTQAIENRMGRKRDGDKPFHPKEPYTSRIMDIDILFYGNLRMYTPELTIPHPLLHLRPFTLVPLTEILPDYVHPVLNKPLNEIPFNRNGVKKI